MANFAVLLVDDSRTSRMYTTTSLRRHRPELNVLEAASGAVALQLLDEHDADAAILDMNMPGMTGLELAEELRKRRPNMRLVMLTANVQEGMRRRAAALQLAFFAKPLSDAATLEILTLLCPAV